MDPVLQSLIRYQELSLQRDSLEKALQSFPHQTAAIDKELQEATGDLDSAKLRAEDGRKQRRLHEGELQDYEQKLKKYNEQLMQVKTNDEYRAMQKEIDGVKSAIGAIEEKILLLMEEIDQLEKQVREEEAVLQQHRKEADARKAEIEKKRHEVAGEASRVDDERRAAESTLGSDVLELFNRIASIRHGVAVARAFEERCLECKVRIRPQIFQDVRKNERIIQCDSCGRILYFSEQSPT